MFLGFVNKSLFSVKVSKAHDITQFPGNQGHRQRGNNREEYDHFFIVGMWIYIRKIPLFAILMAIIIILFYFLEIAYIPDYPSGPNSSNNSTSYVVFFLYPTLFRDLLLTSSEDHYLKPWSPAEAGLCSSTCGEAITWVVFTVLSTLLIITSSILTTTLWSSSH